ASVTQPRAVVILDETARLTPGLVRVDSWPRLRIAVHDAQHRRIHFQLQDARLQMAVNLLVIRLGLHERENTLESVEVFAHDAQPPNVKSHPRCRVVRRGRDPRLVPRIDPDQIPQPYSAIIMAPGIGSSHAASSSSGRVVAWVNGNGRSNSGNSD